MTPSPLGKAVLARRLRRGWSQARLAREAGIDQATVCRLESGTRLTASYRNVIKLAAAFGCDITRLEEMPE